MYRYFLEVGYKGTEYAGFQVQQNANTIQAELEKALKIFLRKNIELTGSSRTDAGVHAFQNYFMVDVDVEMEEEKTAYHVNAILPRDIVLKKIKRVKAEAHSRFDALYRSYEYTITANKNPFLLETAYYYPYQLDLHAMNDCAAMLLQHSNFQSFSKKNTQVFTHECTITHSLWKNDDDLLKYEITGNRFLRGMVRGLVATMLLVGRGKYTILQFKEILESCNATNTDFSAPAQGLILKKVAYNDDIFLDKM